MTLLFFLGQSDAAAATGPTYVPKTGGMWRDNTRPFPRNSPLARRWQYFHSPNTARSGTASVSVTITVDISAVKAINTGPTYSPKLGGVFRGEGRYRNIARRLVQHYGTTSVNKTGTATATVTITPVLTGQKGALGTATAAVTVTPVVSGAKQAFGTATAAATVTPAITG